MYYWFILGKRGCFTDLGLLINADILTVSLPFFVFAVTVTVLETLLAPLPLNLTVNCEDSPGDKGCLLQPWGTVQPQVL